MNCTTIIFFNTCYLPAKCKKTVTFSSPRSQFFTIGTDPTK